MDTQTSPRRNRAVALELVGTGCDGRTRQGGEMSRSPKHLHAGLPAALNV